MGCCGNKGNDIFKTFIIEPLSVTGGSISFSACNTVYTSAIQECSGSTKITLTGGVITFNSDIAVSGSVTALDFISGGTNLLDIFNSNDNFLTGGTYINSGDTLELYMRDNTSVIITGITDTFVTGGTIINSADTITLTRNDNTTVLITGVTDTFITGGSFVNSADTVTLTRNDNTTVLITGITDTFVTGGTYMTNTLTLTRNDNVNVTITAITDNFTTGATLIENTVYFDRNDTLSAFTLDLGNIPFSGGSGNCVSDLYVTNIWGCSPITFNDEVRGINGSNIAPSYSFSSFSGSGMFINNGNLAFSNSGQTIYNTNSGGYLEIHSGITNYENIISANTNAIPNVQYVNNVAKTVTELSMNTDTKLYKNASSQSYVSLGRTRIMGTNDKVLNNIYVVAWSDIDWQGSIRVVDITNNNIISEINNVTPTATTVLSMTAITNLPTSSAVVDVQVKRNNIAGFGNVYISTAHFEY